MRQPKSITLRKENVRDLWSHGDEDYVLVRLPQHLRKELDQELRQLRQLGVPAKALTYESILVLSFQYYRSRCEAVDAVTGSNGEDLWSEWLQKLR